MNNIKLHRHDDRIIKHAIVGDEVSFALDSSEGSYQWASTSQYTDFSLPQNDGWRGFTILSDERIAFTDIQSLRLKATVPGKYQFFLRFIADAQHKTNSSNGYTFSLWLVVD